MSAPSCPACGRGAAEPIERFTVADQHALYAPADEGLRQRLTAAAAAAALEYQMLRCRHCGLEFTSPLRAPSSDWYRLAYDVLDIYAADRWEFDEVLRHANPGEDLVEVGCGSGAFLETCRQRGLTASGVDFSAEAIALPGARIARPPTGLGRGPGWGGWRQGRPCRRLSCPRTSRPAGRSVPFRRAATRCRMHLWLSVPSDRRFDRCFGLSRLSDEPPHHMTRWTRPPGRDQRAPWLADGAKFCTSRSPMVVAVWWISVSRAPIHAGKPPGASATGGSSAAFARSSSPSPCSEAHHPAASERAFHVGAFCLGGRAADCRLG